MDYNPYSMREDMDKLRIIDPAYSQSLQNELYTAMPYHEKALHSIKMLDLKDMIELKSLTLSLQQFQKRKSLKSQ